MSGDRGQHLQRSRRVWGAVAIVAVAAVGVAGIAVALWPDDPAPVEAVAPSTTVPVTTTVTTEPPTAVPRSTSLASPIGSVPTFDAPDGNRIGEAGYWYGFHMTMPIVEERGEWLRIRLPERPNGATAWVHRSGVTLSSSTYRIVIDVGRTTLTVYKDGEELFAAPVGVGTDATPTAKGSFFVANIEAPGPSGYGPIVLDTSGHSEAIQSWEGSGDAITSIHGPISSSSDARIGTTGTQISNGCIRMHVEDQLKLQGIPLGTPVDIV